MVRKRGTEQFMFPGGKPEPGETAAAAAVREIAEELAVELDPSLLQLIGVFTARAANEPDWDVEATVYTHPLVPISGPAREIEELRWQTLDEYQHQDDLAPLLADHVFPVLRTIDRPHPCSGQLPEMISQTNTHTSGGGAYMTSTTDTEPKPLFYEPGASWWWVLTGPASAVAMMFINASQGYQQQLLVPLFFLVVVSGFIGLQVKAARIHSSVELTADTLRQGTETIKVAEIRKVYPEPENSVASGKELQKWQSARALGELVGVPRGRVGIGLKLTEGRTAQAWARRHRHLRAVLTPLVAERVRCAGSGAVDAQDYDSFGNHVGPPR